MPRSIDIRLEPSLVELLITQCFTCKDFLIICNQSKIDTKFWILSGTWGFSTLHQTRFQCQVCLFWFCWWKNASKLSLNLQNRFRCSRYSLMLYCIPLITSLQSNYSLKWYFVMLFTWWLIVVWFSDQSSHQLHIGCGLTVVNYSQWQCTVNGCNQICITVFWL